MDALLFSKNDSEIRKIVEDWGTLTWLAGKNLNGSDLTLGRVIIKKGMSNPRHRHNLCEEVLYLLKGKLRHSFADKDIVMNPGDTLIVPPGVAHNAVNIGDDDADMIVAFSSGSRDFQLENSVSKH